MIASFFVALLASGQRLRLGEVEVVGPIGGIVLSLGSAGETRISREFQAGERVRVEVPLPVLDAAAPVPPEVRWTRADALDPGGGTPGSVRFLGWREDRGSSTLESLPPGLRARTRPPVGPAEMHTPLAVLALLPACLVLGLALRRRPWASIALACLGSGAVLALGWPRGASVPQRITVLEGDAASDLRLEVSASFGMIRVRRADLAETLVETSPPGARLVVSGNLEADELWTVTSQGTGFFRLRPVDRGDRTFALEATWVREEGEWTTRGPWPAGEPLPLPGWLAAGLPQGVSVLIGLVSSGTSREVVYFRESGF